jgi:hypothetical protein
LVGSAGLTQANKKAKLKKKIEERIFGHYFHESR